jgi:hypothetical protein
MGSNFLIFNANVTPFNKFHSYLLYRYSAITGLSLYIVDVNYSINNTHKIVTFKYFSQENIEKVANCLNFLITREMKLENSNFIFISLLPKISEGGPVILTIKLVGPYNVNWGSR